jgi:hypothetical protein
MVTVKNDRAAEVQHLSKLTGAIVAALSNGAKGYVWKQDASIELLPAVEQSS